MELTPAALFERTTVVFTVPPGRRFRTPVFAAFWLKTTPAALGEFTTPVPETVRTELVCSPTYTAALPVTVPPLTLTTAWTVPVAVEPPKEPMVRGFPLTVSDPPLTSSTPWPPPRAMANQLPTVTFPPLTRNEP